MTSKPILFTILLTAAAAAQNPAANYDESKVPAYTLPDPLVLADGRKVTSVESWQKQRRPELLRLFEEQVYGRAPGRPAGQAFQVTSVATDALGGTATRKEVAIRLTGVADGPTIRLLLYVPNGTNGRRVPAFLGLNFGGNHTVTADPGISLSDRWVAGGGRGSCVANNRATEACRGTAASQWAVEKIIARGCALATVYYGDLEPDSPEGWKLGIRAALGADGARTAFEADQWGAISAWAWGLSRVMDYLETDRAIDATRVALFGHSRLGKTALWAGARDPRFSIVISNNSGAGGAALSRRIFGETAAHQRRLIAPRAAGDGRRSPCTPPSRRRSRRASRAGCGSRSCS